MKLFLTITFKIVFKIHLSFIHFIGNNLQLNMHRINKCFIKEHIYGTIYWTTNHAKNMSKLMSQISLMNKKKLLTHLTTYQLGNKFHCLKIM